MLSLWTTIAGSPRGTSRRTAARRWHVEPLEARILLSAADSASISPLSHEDASTPNDPYFGELWGMQKIQAEQAWDVSTGSTSIVAAGVDTGIDYTHPDLYLNIWINQGEIPQRVKSLWAARGIDVHGDGLLTFWDLNDPHNRTLGLATDLNANGYIDGGDILALSNPLVPQLGGWADGVNDDGNGFTFSDPDLGTWTVEYTDDLIGWDFANEDNDPIDDNGHGTHTAGTIAAVGDNDKGVAGVNWQLQIMPLKFMNALGVEFSTQNAVEAIYYAGGMGARVSNHSWGGAGFGQNDTSDPLYRAIKEVGEQYGHLIVAAAGNGGLDAEADDNDVPSEASYPASYDLPNIISVTATDQNDEKPFWANYGQTTVDLGAPGVDILSTFTTVGTGNLENLKKFLPGVELFVDAGYAYFSGTSMAAPHVAGAAALIWSVNPGLDHLQVKDLILDNVDPVASLEGITVTGGRLNLASAVGGTTAEPSDPAPVPGPGQGRGRGREHAPGQLKDRSDDPIAAGAGMTWEQIGTLLSPAARQRVLFGEFSPEESLGTEDALDSFFASLPEEPGELWTLAPSLGEWDKRLGAGI